MNDPDKIRSVVARFFNVPESAVTEEFTFPADRLQGSVGRTTFHAALKRLAGADLPAALTATTYRQLLAAPAAEPAQTPDSPASPRAPGQPIPPIVEPANRQNGFGVGIDIESVESLPVAKDPWSDAFYRDNFTEAEIAYCQRQTDPRMSFCGLWSAKEAAMKCDPEIAGLRPIQIEITHDEQRRPGLRVHEPVPDRAPEEYALSISHAGRMVVAVCVRKPAATLWAGARAGADDDTPSPPEGQSGSDEERAAERRPIPVFIWLNLGLSLLALALWCITWLARK
jgi:phosphopantetheine--protein transferase-like protein